MTITALKAQVKNPERVSIFVDGRYSFSLNHAQLLEQKIRIGQKIDTERLAALKRISDLGKLYERLLNYVTIRPRSKREIEDYCRRKKVEAADAEGVIERLTERGYVNDKAFAKAWVESRRLTKASSSRKLRLELKQKGVSDEIILETLQESSHTDQNALKQLIDKKRRLTKYQDDQKLMQYLARQGFNFDDIKASLSQED